MAGENRALDSWNVRKAASWVGWGGGGVGMGRVQFQAWFHQGVVGHGEWELELECWYGVGEV